MERARGEIGYPPTGAVEEGNLRGTPIRSKFMWYAPTDKFFSSRSPVEPHQM